MQNVQSLPLGKGFSMWKIYDAGASGPGGHFIKHVYLYITFFCRNFGGVAVSRATPGAGGGILEECFSSHGGSLNH